MPASLALRAPVPASTDYIGAPSAGLLHQGYMGDHPAGLDRDPGAGLAAVGAALQSLSSGDAVAVLEALAEQAAALSLVLAADSAGAITLPESLRTIVQSASVLPAFLGGAN
jgi:hypothetical protein